VGIYNETDTESYQPMNQNIFLGLGVKVFFCELGVRSWNNVSPSVGDDGNRPIKIATESRITTPSH